MNDILEYKTYIGAVSFSAKDDIFHGKIVGINDLVNFEGATVKDLKQAFKEAVDDYLDTCKQLGKEPEKTYKGSFNVRIPSELHRQAARQAMIKDMSLNDFVRYSIENAMIKLSGKRTKSLILLCLTIGSALLSGFYLLETSKNSFSKIQ